MRRRQRRPRTPTRPTVGGSSSTAANVKVSVSSDVGPRRAPDRTSDLSMSSVTAADQLKSADEPASSVKPWLNTAASGDTSSSAVPPFVAADASTLCALRSAWTLASLAPLSDLFSMLHVAGPMTDPSPSMTHGTSVGTVTVTCPSSAIGSGEAPGSSGTAVPISPPAPNSDSVWVPAAPVTASSARAVGAPAVTTAATATPRAQAARPVTTGKPLRLLAFLFKAPFPRPLERPVKTFIPRSSPRRSFQRLRGRLP